MSSISKILIKSTRALAARTVLTRSYSSLNRLACFAYSNKNLQSTTSLPNSNVYQLNSYATDAQNNEVHKKIDSIIKKDSIVVFMKGTAEQPLCGFSKAVVDILNMHGVKFQSYNVLADEALRSGIKEFTNWPTIPQVFFKGEFVGGCDILLEMHRSGELVDELEKIGFKSELADQEETQKNDKNKTK